MSPFFAREPDWPRTLGAELEQGPVEIPLRVHPRARSYRLTINAGGSPVLTVPPHGRLSEARQFLVRHAAWLDARLKRAPGPVDFAPGNAVPLRGVAHRLASSGTLRGRAALGDGPDGPTIIVPGAPEHFARRLTDWLKLEAAIDLEERVIVHARRLEVRHKSISLRDQSTRWGSCASSGRLNFNWRLILAPPFVLDYVAAHEVAHLLQMNHSPAFWSTVEKTLPDYKPGRAWLKANGRTLMAYGVR